MKRILLLIVPVILIMLAFRPVNSHTIKGTISDDAGNPVMGASIRVKGTTAGTSSGSNGSFTMVLADKNSTLVISALGYVSKEIKVNGRSVVNITLSATKTEMQEVVVTALGQKSQPVNLQNGLTGRVSGLKVNGDKQGYYGMDEEKMDFNREGYDNNVAKKFLI